MASQRSGFTIYEIVFCFGLISILAGYIVSTVHWESRSYDASKRVVSSSKLRTISIILNKHLREASEFYVPALNDSSSQIVFSNHRGEVVCIYVDHQGNLNLFNREQDENRRLVSSVEHFEASQDMLGKVEYKLSIETKEDKLIQIANASRITNTLP